MTTKQTADQVLQEMVAAAEKAFGTGSETSEWVKALITGYRVRLFAALTQEVRHGE